MATGRRPRRPGADRDVRRRHHEQNLSRAEGFKKMVEAAGGHWPQDWVKGEGFVRPKTVDAYTPPPKFPMLGLEYVDQIVDLSPGQRRRYRDQIGVLARTEVRGAPMTSEPGAWH